MLQLPKEEKTFVMVKPDGVRKGLIGEIIKRFEQRDLKIIALEMFQPTKDEMNDHYPKTDEWIAKLGNNTLKTYEKYNHDPVADYGTNDAMELGKMVRQWLIDYMTSAPLVRMVVQGIHAVDVVRKIVGPTMPYVAELGTIRGDYSIDSPLLANNEKRAIMNLIHASDKPDEALREIKHWFGENAKTFSYKRFGVDES